MRALATIGVGCVLVAAIWAATRGHGSGPDAGKDAAPAPRSVAFDSYVLKKLLPGPLVPAEPMFLVVSPCPATLAEGTPPT